MTFAPFAASGWLHPTLAIAAMASSTLGILLSSFGLRLSRLATFSVPALEVRPTTAQPAVDGVAVQGYIGCPVFIWVYGPAIGWLGDTNKRPDMEIATCPGLFPFAGLETTRTHQR